MLFSILLFSLTVLSWIFIDPSIAKLIGFIALCVTAHMFRFKDEVDDEFQEAEV